jgi:hypothetical protein
VKSTRSAIDAIVAMYFSFARPNIVIKAPLSTPPVPMSPAVNPESAHQILHTRGVGAILNSGFQSEYIAKIERTIARMILRISGFTFSTRETHITVAMKLGIPKRKNIRLSQC